MMNMDVVLLAWATAMLFLLYKTNSLKTSIATTAIVLAFFVASVLHMIIGEICDMFIIAATISILVFRIIPYDSTDKWKKRCY